jgi:hypothetical protein
MINTKYKNLNSTGQIQPNMNFEFCNILSKLVDKLNMLTLIARN